MTIILPRIGINIDQYAMELNQQKWDILLSGLDSTEVNLCLPKFRLKYNKTLNDELKNMGMSIAFDPSANFSNIIPGIRISRVIHKTFIEVNEKGTEAAAATAVEFIRSAMGDREIVMRIDRPFIFAIRERVMGNILFIGKVVNPDT